MRKNIVAGNWKMNKSFDEADDLVNGIMELLEKKELGKNTLMILCPPFPYLEMVSDYSNDSYFMVGAQNVNDNEKGAYTGEVSAEMLSSMDIEYCIVGHSERRAYYGETDAMIAKKVDQLLKHEIRPIVCCGEVLEEREAGLHPQDHCRQVRQRGCRRNQHPLWRQLQALECQRALCKSRCRRRPDWWRRIAGRGLCQHCTGFLN